MAKRTESNSTSANSLFSLDNCPRSPFLPSRDRYYYEQSEIDEEAPLIQEIGKLQRASLSPHLPLEFETRSRKIPKYVFILVGLPAVGKSSTCSHMIRHLSRQASTENLKCRIYNAGRVRRSISSHDLGLSSMRLANNSTEDLFNPKNYDKKEKYAKITLKNLLDDLNSDKCDVAFFDATNSTVDRRRFVFQEVCSYNQTSDRNFCIVPIILQISCNNREFIKFNVHNKSFNADYYDKPYEYAVKDFARRLMNYHSQFAPFTKREFSRLVDSFVPKRGLDYGAFCFNIVDAGTVPTRNDAFGVVPVQSYKVRNMIILVAEFCENYTKLFGHSYVGAVDSFFDKENQGHSKFLSVLNSVINDQFLSELKSTVESNVNGD